MYLGKISSCIVLRVLFFCFLAQKTGKIVLNGKNRVMLAQISFDSIHNYRSCHLATSLLTLNDLQNHTKSVKLHRKWFDSQRMTGDVNETRGIHQDRKQQA